MKSDQLAALLSCVIDHRGKTPKKLGGDFTATGIPVLSARHISGGEIVGSEELRFISQEMYEKWMPNPLRQGDVILTSEAPLGELYWLKDKTKFVLGQRLFGLRPDPEKLNSGYLYYYLKTPLGQAALHGRASGSTVQGIRQSELLKVEIELPDTLDEQCGIAELLSSLDDRIDHNRALATNLEAIARRLFKSWFVDFDPVRAKAAGEKPAGLADDIAALFPDRFVESEIGEVPEGWAISKLGDLCTLIKGRSYKSSDLAESKTALVTLKSFRRGGGFRSDGFKSYTGTYKEEQIIHSGECVIAFTDVTQQADVIGRAALVQSSPLHETLIASLDTAILRSKVDGLTPQFLYLVCQTDAYVEHVLKFVTGSTVLHLAKDAVPTYAFALPSEKLLIEFNAISSPIFEKIKCSQAEITRLTDLRDLLLPRLISGKLRVEDAETVIEEAVA